MCLDGIRQDIGLYIRRHFSDYLNQFMFLVWQRINRSGQQVLALMKLWEAGKLPAPRRSPVRRPRLPEDDAGTVPPVRT
jgi:hypothetical protein